MKMTLARSLLITATIGLTSACTMALADSASPLKVVTITNDLTRPWGLTFLPDGRMLVTEKSGALRYVDKSGQVSAPIKGVPKVVSVGQGGLLDVALAPDFDRSKTIVLTFSEPASEGKARTSVARATLSANTLTDLKVIFRQEPAVHGSGHFGSRALFNRDGHLMVTLGERRQQDYADKKDNHLGKVIRISLDGSPIEDNPFIDEKGSKPELYSYGHRNPQGAALHPTTGQLWVVEHGPQGGDEVNAVVKGANFGWPRITYGKNYGSGTTIGEGSTAPDVQAPMHYWVPRSIGPSGLAFYNGDKIPALKGSLLVGALGGRALVRLELKDGKIIGEQRMLEHLRARIRDVRQGPDGYVYLLTDDGQLLQIRSH